MKVPDSLENKVVNGEDVDERDQDVYWKIKGMATKITYRLFIKYGSPRKKGKDYF